MDIKAKINELVEKIKAIKAYIATIEQDENTAQLLTYIAEIEKDIKGKKYGLVFEEHRESIDETLENNLPVLVEDESLFIDNGGQMNFLIEGDNLASLKLLEKTHKGKIDVIYIDPPYNTGNKDFVYDDTFIDENDTFNSSGSESKINNYDHSTKKNETIKAPGEIRRLTASVMVNGNLDATTQKAFEDAVKAAIGFDEERKDTISLVGMAFDPTESENAQKQLEEYQAALEKEQMFQKLLTKGGAGGTIRVNGAAANTTIRSFILVNKRRNL